VAGDQLSMSVHEEYGFRLNIFCEVCDLRLSMLGCELFGLKLNMSVCASMAAWLENQISFIFMDSYFHVFFECERVDKNI
jgi:hypothetical protein